MYTATTGGKDRFASFEPQMHAAMRELGCEMGQGYLFAPPTEVVLRGLQIAA